MSDFERAVWSSPVVHVVVAAVQCHVVPRDGLGQGVFVYRGGELVANRGWRGLDLAGHTDDGSEHLARIRVDLPDGFDGAWEPDADSTAKLSRLADDIIRRSNLEYDEHGPLQAL
jgi:hypothetical protein